MLAQRTVIVVSPYFPPSTLAGVHRGRHLAKHLPAAGWKPIVVCVDEAHHEERLDPELADLVPRTVEVLKTGAVPARWTRPLGIGDLGLRGWAPLRRTVWRLLASRPIHAVLITGAPYYPMLMASAIRRRFGVPVVLDFQDPWVSAWGAAQPARTKAGLSHQLACWLEPNALRHAQFVTSVSETQNAEMAARHAWLDSERMAAIPIGGDPEDFVSLRAGLQGRDYKQRDPAIVRLSYVGTFLPRAAPVLRTLFRSFARLRAAAPALATRIRLDFVGTSTHPNDDATYRVRSIADGEGVADAVCERPARIPYLEALGVLARSDGLLLIGSDEPHYTASKIYPALMSGRPFLSLFHRASSAHAILAAAGGGRALAFATPEELAGLEAPLADTLRELATEPEALGRVDPAAYAPYEASEIARRFANVFDRVAAEPAATMARR